jgi:hypothetical protein
MPLTMFVGSNHQLLNVVFGQALLKDELSDSFEWLFKTFKACMGRSEPHVLLMGKCCFFLHVLVLILFLVTHCKNHELQMRIPR